MNKKFLYKKDKKRLPENIASRQSFLFSKAAFYIISLASVTALSALSAIFIFDAADDALALSVSEKPYTAQIEIQELSELPSALGGAGIIKHPWLFELYMNTQSPSAEPSNKSATVNTNMDYRALLRSFTAPPPIRSLRISIPLGASTDDIINIFVQNGFGSRDAFVEVINTYPFEFDFIEDIPNADGRLYRLDGYLYPDTYDFYTGRNESYYIYKLLDRFELVTKDIRDACASKGKSFDDTLKIASMIQCSSAYVSQYETLSAVIRNRLAANEPLKVPASSAYAINKKGGLYIGEASDEIKNLASPYNTFEVKGLPPGAVCNPSHDALLCALYPENSKYMYFVTDNDGRALFAYSQKGHLENINLLKQAQNQRQIIPLP